MWITISKNLVKLERELQALGIDVPETEVCADEPSDHDLASSSERWSGSLKGASQTVTQFEIGDCAGQVAW